MSVGQIVGAAILVLVFGGIFATTARGDGWAVAAGIWGLALLLTGLIYLGVFLVFGS